jgi:hypothetical protein
MPHLPNLERSLPILITHISIFSLPNPGRLLPTLITHISILSLPFQDQLIKFVGMPTPT